MLPSDDDCPNLFLKPEPRPASTKEIQLMIEYNATHIPYSDLPSVLKKIGINAS